MQTQRVLCSLPLQSASPIGLTGFMLCTVCKSRHSLCGALQLRTFTAGWQAERLRALDF